ncbi:substrate-binding domain-containing protein [Dactylosporangium sp. CA-233914]|uniref:substrate-binding domain-containing protein n=1 Tax=Dactylosporangium sp. CA-233914 TaxID=3239934 RepID=UPI003D90F0DD
MRGIIALAVASATLLAPAADHARIEGTGSSWLSNAVNTWIAAGSGTGLQVSYTALGSQTGRRDFANGISDFGATDVPFGQVGDPAVTRPYVYAPVAGTAVGFPYHLMIDGKLKRDLRLSGRTLAGIFTGKITNWSDPAITADNGQPLPALPIIPVVEATESGASLQFSSYLAENHPDLYHPFVPTAYFPQQGPVVPRLGADSVMNSVLSAGGNGAIGVVPLSYALDINYPVAAIGNAFGRFIPPNWQNTSLALAGANDPRAYPVAGYTSAILPTGTDAQDPRMTTAKRQTIVDFLAGAVCRGQSGLSSRGYAPLPLNLVRQTFDQLSKLRDADPAVDLSALDLSRCDNPTFDPSNLGRDLLDEITPAAPVPQNDIPIAGQNDTEPWAGALTLQVATGSRVTLTQVDPATAAGHPAQGTDPTGHRHAWVFQGDLAGVSVVDTRPAQPGWQLVGRMSDMTSEQTSIPAHDLGWVPQAGPGGDAEGTVTIGGTVAPGMRAVGSPGLGEGQMLGAAPAGSGLGTQPLGARMELWMPDTSPTGRYSGTLTLTLIGG